MNCYNCNSDMECIKEIKTNVYRLDLYECPICNSEAEVRYKSNGEDIKMVLWRKD